GPARWPSWSGWPTPGACTPRQDQGPILDRGTRAETRSMIGRSGLVILVTALSITSTGFRDTTAPGDDAAPMAGPATRPLDVVTSSVACGLASLRSPPPGLSTC